MGLISTLTGGLIDDKQISGSPAEKSRSQSTASSFNESLNQALSGNESSSSGSSRSVIDSLNQAGIAPMGGLVSGAAIRNQRLMESTHGLGFGLHRSRH